MSYIEYDTVQEESYKKSLESKVAPHEDLVNAMQHLSVHVLRILNLSPYTPCIVTSYQKTLKGEDTLYCIHCRIENEVDMNRYHVGILCVYIWNREEYEYMEYMEQDMKNCEKEAYEFIHNGKCHLHESRLAIHNLYSGKLDEAV